MIKKIVQIGNLIIRRKSKKVSVINKIDIKVVIKNLIDSMHYHELIGIAAPQLGVNQRIFVIEIRKTISRKNIKEKQNLQVYINLKIIWRSNEVRGSYEGCGSVAFANIFGTVIKASKIIVRAYNEEGEIFTQSASGLLARVIQHEYDHLNGIVFVDKVSNTRKLMSRDEYIKK